MVSPPNKTAEAELSTPANPGACGMGAWVIGAWALFVGGYALVALLAESGWVAALAPGSPGLTAMGNLIQCVVPLFANAGLLTNAVTPYRRWNMFWGLLALGCTLWLVGQLMWTYFEVQLRQPVPNPFLGDAVFFLHTVPMIAALAMRPHLRRVGESLRHGMLDSLMLVFWWIYLYLFIVVPWQYVELSAENYGRSYNILYSAENVVLLAGLGVYCIQASQPWKTIYAHLFGAVLTYSASAHVINSAIDRHRYYTGSLYDIPLIASFVWLGMAGFVAFRLRPAPVAGAESPGKAGRWPRLLATAGVLSLPLLAGWSAFFSAAPEGVRDFRLILTLGAIVAGSGLVFLRQYLVDKERLRLLRGSQESLDNLRRLQAQFVQSEKLASLGQLAAGAAHEINNPLTAIMGYTDLLMDDPSVGERPKTLVAKLRDQARRTKTLVNNLLSFARQVPAEKVLLDVNGIVNSALQLRTLDLRDKNIRIEIHTESVVPGVRGDPNQLLQVFFNIISNAVDAMEETHGGVLTVRTARERANVIIEFFDTGPGMKDPHLVFDPFYTTKPVGKGTGLGLSICYGILQEHSGRITARNLPGGGTSFRVELPAVIALLPQALTSVTSPKEP